MPAPGTMDPGLTRERMVFETDEQYAERLKRIDDIAQTCRTLLGRIPLMPKDPTP